MKNEEPKNGYIPRKTFFWIMGTVFAVIGFMFLFMLNLGQTFNHNVTDLKVDVAEIKTDLRLLRQELSK